MLKWPETSKGLKCCFDIILMVLNGREEYTLDVLREISAAGYLSFSINFLKSFCGGLDSKPWQEQSESSSDPNPV